MDYTQSTKLHPDDNRTQITTYNVVMLYKAQHKMLCYG